MTLVLAESRRALLDGIKAEVHAAGSRGKRNPPQFAWFRESYELRYDLGTATVDQLRRPWGDPLGCRRPVLGALQV